MSKFKLKPVTEPDCWLEVDVLEYLRLPAIKMHLIRNCGFREIDWRRFFQLYNQSKKELCEVFGVESIPDSWFKEETEDQCATILLEALCQATKVGPRTERVINKLSEKYERENDV